MSDRESRTVPTGDAPGAAGAAAGETPPEHQPPPPGAGFMNALRWGLFAGLMLLAALSVGSYVVSKRPGAGEAKAAKAQKAARYRCPMHPSYTSDKPGECPICGMSLEPIPASDAHSGHEAAGHSGDVPGLTSVHLTPERIQLIGVRTAVVQRRRMGGTLDLVGFVTPDEGALRRVQLRVSGWVRQLHVSRTGEWVAEGQPLLSIYSPELYQSEREYLIEVGTGRDSLPQAAGHGASPPGVARERLHLLGVPEDEILRLERERTASTRLVLRAPVSGTVLERGVVEGQYVAADTPLFTVADLSRVWVLADLYEMDFSRARVGDPARFTADALPGRSFDARVDFIYPTVTSDTRTLKVRLTLDNPGIVLRPGMYGRVRLTGEGAPSLAVPVEAVVYAGDERYLFLARAGGHFEPRRVQLGIQESDWVQVLDGVAPGDTVVASASFLIDSESRLKAAIAGMGAQPSAGHQH